MATGPIGSSPRPVAVRPPLLPEQPPPPGGPQSSQARRPLTFTDGFEYDPRANALRGAGTPSPDRRTQLENAAARGLAYAERDLALSIQSSSNRGVFGRLAAPTEDGQRVRRLQQQVPELQRLRSDYQAARAANAPDADAKLETYARAASQVRGSITASLAKEQTQLAAQQDALQTAANRSSVVRDTALSTTAALASGGTSLAVTGAVVAGGALVKTASQEGALRTENKGRDARGIAAGFVRNTVGLAADAGGGAATRSINLAAQTGRVGIVAAATANAGVGITTGAAKRAADGKDVFDSRAVIADAVGGAAGSASERFKATSEAGFAAAGAVGGAAQGAAKRAADGERVLDPRALAADALGGAAQAAVNRRLGPIADAQGPRAKLATLTASNTAGAAASTALTNAATGKPLDAGVFDAAVGGAGKGVADAYAPQPPSGRDAVIIPAATRTVAPPPPPSPKLRKPEG